MARYEVTFTDHAVEVIDDADAYQQEGPMTTFFVTGPGRQVVDCWSTRIASFRTSEVIIIRRVEQPAAALDRTLDDDRGADGDDDLDRDEVIHAPRHGSTGVARAVLVHRAS